MRKCYPTFEQCDHYSPKSLLILLSRDTLKILIVDGFGARLGHNIIIPNN